MIGVFDAPVGEMVIAYKKNLEAEVLTKVERLKQGGWANEFDKS